MVIGSSTQVGLGLPHSSGALPAHPAYPLPKEVPSSLLLLSASFPCSSFSQGRPSSVNMLKALVRVALLKAFWREMGAQVGVWSGGLLMGRPLKAG